jgi:hypothetical protein
MLLWKLGPPKHFQWATAAECKESLRGRQRLATIASPCCVTGTVVLSVNLTIVRRNNVLALFQAHAEQALAAGQSPKGLEQAFAAALQVSPSMWSQIKSARPIGDKLARQIEALCGKPAGWLDQPQAAPAPSPAEKAFLDLALQAWRGSNSEGRRQLRLQMKTALSAVAKR